MAGDKHWLRIMELAGLHPTDRSKLIRAGGIAAIAVVALFLLMVPSQRDDAVSDAAKVQKRRDAPMKVSARELNTAFEANPAQAQLVYGHRPLMVSGKVAAAQFYSLSDPVLLLGQSSDQIDAQAQIAQNSGKTAPTLLVGQDVELMCSGVSQIVGAPQLVNCEIRQGPAK